jgi:hypothetical protein
VFVVGYDGGAEVGAILQVDLARCMSIRRRSAEICEIRIANPLTLVSRQ